MSEVGDYDYIRFSVADIHGRSKGRVVPVRHAQTCIDSGVTMSGGTLFDGLTVGLTVSMDNTNIPRAIMKPDMETIYSVPWCGGDKYKVAEVICESYWLQDCTPQQACPRYVARKQLERLADHGFSLLSGFEVEYLCNKNEHHFPSEINYMSQRIQTKHSDFLFEIENHMHNSGVDIHSFHCEDDENTFEVALTPLKGISSADAAVKFKNNIQEIADQRSCLISFSPKHGDRIVDITLQLNHSLWSVSGDVNVFDTKEGLSETGKHWVAGLMKHAKALTALYCPTNDCYSRLHQIGKPGMIFWGTDDSESCVKVKCGHIKKCIYLENRMSSAMSNPYILLAATVAAGLDGIINRLQCPPQGKESAVGSLPHTLSEALEELMVDTDMIGYLGKEFVDWFVSVIRSGIISQ